MVSRPASACRVRVFGRSHAQRFDGNDQMGRVGVAGFGKVDLVAGPGGAALVAVAGVGVVEGVETGSGERQRGSSKITPISSHRRTKRVPLGKAARATRWVSSGTGAISQGLERQGYPPRAKEEDGLQVCERRQRWTRALSPSEGSRYRTPSRRFLG